jgi:hypothetical protein
LDIIKEFKKVKAKEDNIKLKLSRFKKTYDLENTEDDQEEKYIFMKQN